MKRSRAPNETTPLRSLILASVLLVASQPAHAALFDAMSALTLRVNSDEVTFRRAGALRERVPGSYSNGVGGSFVGAATGETGQDSGRRFASARALSLSQGPGNAPGESAAVAVLDYDVRLITVAPTPVPILYVPGTVNVRASAFASASGDAASNSAFAVARVSVGSLTGTSVDAFAAAGTDSEEENRDFEFLYIPGETIDVSLYASVISMSGLNLGGPLATSAVGTAFADPVFSFDQEAFDDFARQQGFATFDLAAHFAFEESRFAAPIPEPASALLMLAGGLLVAGVYRRRRSAA